MSSGRFHQKRGACWIVAGLLPVLPLVAVVIAQRVHPVGGLTSMLVRVAVLAFFIGAAEAAMLSPLRHRMPAWSPWLVLSIVTAAAIPIQMLTPSLPD